MESAYKEMGCLGYREGGGRRRENKLDVLQWGVRWSWMERERDEATFGKGGSCLPTDAPSHPN